MPAKLLKDVKQALEELNVDQLVELYATNFLFEDIPAELCITDRTALQEYYRHLFSTPQASFSNIRVFEADTFAAIEWSWGGVSNTTGKPFQVRGVSVLELSSSKVLRESIYYDPKPALS